MFGRPLPAYPGRKKISLGGCWGWLESAGLGRLENVNRTKRLRNHAHHTAETRVFRCAPYRKQWSISETFLSDIMQQGEGALAKRNLRTMLQPNDVCQRILLTPLMPHAHLRLKTLPTPLVSGLLTPQSLFDRIAAQLVLFTGGGRTFSSSNPRLIPPQTAGLRNKTAK
jgi:hypothetical protein